MSLDVGSALRDGLGRMATRNAAVVVAAFLALGLLSVVTSSTLSTAVQSAGVLPAPNGSAANATAANGSVGPFPGFPGDQQPTPFALSLSLPVAIAFALAVALAAEAARVVAVRTFVSEHTERVPEEFLRRHIAVATLNSAIGNVVVGILVAVGLLLFVAPGVFLAVAFFFVRQEVAVEDRNFADAMAESWSLAEGSRLEVLALGLVLLSVGLVASLPPLAISSVAPVAARVVGVVTGAVTTVFGMAVAARAYDQLRAERAAGSDDGEAVTGSEDEELGALDPEDIDEMEFE